MKNLLNPITTCWWVALVLVIFDPSPDSVMAQESYPEIAQAGSFRSSPLPDPRQGNKSARSLESMLKKLEAQYEVFFTYKNSDIEEKYVDQNFKVSASANLEKTLKKMLTPLGLEYEQLENNFYIIFSQKSNGLKKLKSQKQGLLFPGNNLQQHGNQKINAIKTRILPELHMDRRISGKVTDENGEGVPGVNVLVKGSAIGTVTDVEGNYQLDVPDDAPVLVFSSIGYITREVEINGRSVIDITLSQDITSLEEVVVVGYGTQKKRDLTGAVSSLDGQELRNVAITSVEQGLQGRVAGVNVVQQSGRPGAGMDVQIRGIGTIGNSQPLYVIDGIPVINDNRATGNGRTNAMASINPGDIESMEILKDASAAAIYGARAANGVVLITTKRGVAGKTQVTLDAYTGIQEAWRLLDLTDINGYKELSDELTDNANQPRVAALQDPAELVNRTDWQDEMFRTAPINNVNLGVSGGTENARFNVTTNYMNQEGILRETAFERFSVRVNTDFEKGRFKFGESIAFSRTYHKEQTFTFFSIIHHPPNRPVFDENNPGGFSGNRIIDEQDSNNPVGEAELFDRTTTRYRILGTLYGEYEIMDGLSYRINVGGDFIYGYRYNFVPTYAFGDRRNQPFASLEERNANSLSPLIENTLNFSRSFGKHDVGLLVGYTRQTFKQRDATAEGRNTISDDVRVLNGVNDVAAVAGSVQRFSLVSYLGRLTYSYDNRYLLTANIRRDGSSRFSDGNKWGVFPSASVGWRISQEEFFQNVPVVSDLKLRASWGQTGFQEIGNYGFQQALTNTLNYVFDGNRVTGVGPRDLAALDLKWETSTQWDIGLDIGLFRDQLLVNIDYYNKETDDILVPVPVSLSSGTLFNDDLRSPTVNAGSVRNRGLEFAATYRKSVGEFQYSISGNFATLDNEVLSLGGGQPIISGNVNVTRVTRTIEGEPIGHFFGYVMDGIFQTQQEVDAHADQPNAQPGDIRFRDLNNDGVINVDDKTYIGDAIPDLTYGLTLTASYKGFDLNMFVQGVEGVDNYYGYRYFSEGMLRPFNFEERTLGRWTGPGTSNEIPRAVGGDPADNTRESSRFIGDGSFLRMRNLTIGYNVPEAALSTLGGGFISSLRVYATGQNLFTITDYEGYDPEISVEEQASGPEQDDPSQFSLGRGIDKGIFPQARTFMLGVQVTF